MKRLDLTGQQFGWLKVVSPGSNIGRRTRWLCLCLRCGKKCVKKTESLKSGDTRSCICYRRKIMIDIVQPLGAASGAAEKRTHGLTGHPLHEVWISMKQRCHNPNAKNYRRYGGRGIKVCAEWKDFAGFFDWAIQHGWRKGYELDRRENAGPYSPENCQFLTTSEHRAKSNRDRRAC